MYKVVLSFTDLQDGNHIYLVGDEFPRKGANPDKKRIEELSTKFNKRGEVLIEAVETPQKAEILPEKEENKKADKSVAKAEKKPKKRSIKEK